ncbi:hypothetical protein BKA69DRAFT_1055742 [Paraphysoderma sedebokerense]|nr:hypothetical protein BKA69DRAFT_1055742 [Paraphysoderma sedebokerense]
MKSLFLLQLACTLVYLASADLILPQPAVNPSFPKKLFILVPGANVAPENYTDIVKTVQSKATELQVSLYAGITSQKFFNVPDPITLRSAISNVLNGVNKNFNTTFKNKDIILGGHSLGGVMGRMVAKDFGGLVLWASFLSRGDLPKYEVPVLTVGGELDGLTKMHKIAKEFESFVELEKQVGVQTAAVTKPVVILKQVTHSQFCAKPSIAGGFNQFDLYPEIDLQSAYNAIAKVTAAFIAVNSAAPETGSFNNAASILTDSISSTRPLIKGHLEAYKADQKSSSWCEQTQRQVLSGLDGYTVTLNTVTYDSTFSFAQSKPTIKSASSETKQINIELTQQLSYDTATGTIDAGWSHEGPNTIACKTASRDAVLQLVDAKFDGKTFKHQTDICGTMNSMAYTLAKQMVTKEQLERYEKSGAKLEIEKEDEVLGNGFSWVTSGLKLNLFIWFSGIHEF